MKNANGIELKPYIVTATLKGENAPEWETNAFATGHADAVETLAQEAGWRLTGAPEFVNTTRWTDHDGTVYEALECDVDTDENFKLADGYHIGSWNRPVTASLRDLDSHNPADELSWATWDNGADSDAYEYLYLLIERLDASEDSEEADTEYRLYEEEPGEWRLTPNRFEASEPKYVIMTHDRWLARFGAEAAESA